MKKGISLSIDTDTKEEDLVEEKGPFDAVEAEGDDMEILEEDGRDEVEKDEKKDDSDEWKKKVEEEEDFTVKQLTFVEIVADRRAPFPSRQLSQESMRGFGTSDYLFYDFIQIVLVNFSPNTFESGRMIVLS